MTTDVERAVQDYLSHLSVERGLADNTLHSYRRDLRRYLEFLHARELTEPSVISENDVAAFLGSLRTGDTDHVSLGTASAARTIVAVRGLHRFLLREQIVPTDVTAAMPPLDERLGLAERTMTALVADAELKAAQATAGR